MRTTPAEPSAPPNRLGPPPPAAALLPDELEWRK